MEGNTEDEPQSLQSCMYQGLKHLYQARQLCDVTLVAEGKHFPCHRMLLASVSLYFRSMFTSNFRESRDGEIVLQSMAPSTLESVLNYLYTGEISLSSETAEDLFVAASWLQIHPLEETVSRFLQENISTENCFRLCALADIHNHQALLFVATHYIMQEFERLSEEEDFLHLDANILSRIISSDNLTVASELVVCQAVQRWVKFQPAQRLPQQDKLMGHVRFHLMSDAELAEVAHCADVEIPKRQLKGEDGQWVNGGPRQGMYEECIVCMTTGTWDDDCVPRSVCSTNIICFDPKTETFDSLPPLKYVSSSHCTAVEHKLYVSGGYTSGPLNGLSCSDTLYEYSVFTGKWTQLPSMSKCRSGHTFLACNQKLYAVGGHPSMSLDVSGECFDLVQNSWSLIADMPFHLVRVASAVLKAKLYLIGEQGYGYSGRVSSQGFLIYDTNLNRWTERVVGTELWSMTAITMDNGIYLVGMQTKDFWSREAFCDENKCVFLTEDCNVCLNRIPKFPIDVANPGGVQWQGRIYVLGGEGEDDIFNPCNSIYHWAPGESNWTLCPRTLPFDNEERYAFGNVTLKRPKKILPLKRRI
ncbi:kelch-like protein 7 isoform X1 [Alligator sinensis]|uniref:Kelch-like protein 7 isoform X1 n=2 Tax=Alligator sinensis TaxID=38654 RepID=A0A1U7SGC6_ALLSI|nr:kelch-like protein 7 isoform X1 [Alligator sinensis]XP_006030021.1 kelch-like protein 7 isoform X1 [Alligator sinensis]XP_006030022.1 kelch-like protein 7 isoform X1 [Alligator sinensis]